MIIGIPKERFSNEARVAATPFTVNELLKLGFSVCVESNAGVLANFNNLDYEKVNAKIVDRDTVFASDIILKVNAPLFDEVDLFKHDSTLISFIYPEQNSILIESLKNRNINVIAMDAAPHISRAQSIDALRSMANITGYKAVIEAAHEFGKCFTGQVTASGKIYPAKVMVIGADVAGFSAIRTAKNLGAFVRVFDTRKELEEQVKSLGVEFILLDFYDKIDISDSYTKIISRNFLDKEIKLFTHQIKNIDIIITSVVINRNIAPKFLTKEMINLMKPGGIIVDLAVLYGGNCELTQSDKLITTDNGIKIIGYTDFPSRLSPQSSQLYSINILNLIKFLCKDKNGQIDIDFNDSIIRCVTIVKQSKITWVPPIIEKNCRLEVNEHIVKENKKPKKKNKLLIIKYSLFVFTIGLFGWLIDSLPNEFLSHFTIFLLSCIVGNYAVRNVAYILHTPLMFVTNAISGILILGALMQINNGGFVGFLSFIAILITSINIFGGFVITHRILKMFHKK
ncbi:NAD(P) transhydrogenase subunit alpha [Candidatus Providencia siddallii]|uniref:NAD(P) transhydrogenase subunit alpha n=1 Tax=Candidatus Providencia siddallii TaxID=1715285 RepID=A0A0M6W9L2_9GAMM|nr:NAD(P) transhydrogenase subunit alpha [Candidatus Providencia siddallii]